MLGSGERRPITAAVRARGSDRIVWSEAFDRKAEKKVERLIKRVHGLIDGDLQFKSSTQAYKCRSCRFFEVCDKRVEPSYHTRWPKLSSPMETVSERIKTIYSGVHSCTLCHGNPNGNRKPSSGDSWRKCCPISRNDCAKKSACASVVVAYDIFLNWSP